MTILEKFKVFEINKKQLQNKLGENLYNANVSTPCIVFTSDVINAIELYINSNISLDILIDWVNVLWFTELYDYDESNSDSISSVVCELETLDEEDVYISHDELKNMISSLKLNKIYP